MNDMVLIFGRMGHGKSTLAYHRARRANRGVVVFDPRKQFNVGPVVRGEDEFLAALRRDDSPIIYQPRIGVEQHFSEQFAPVLLDMEPGGIAILIDEASRLQSPQGINDYLDALVRDSRSKQNNVFMTMHRPVDANGIVMELATEYVFFQSKHPRSLERIEAFTSADVPAHVRSLERFEYLCWSVVDESYHINHDPASWKVQIHREPVAVPVEEVA